MKSGSTVPIHIPLLVLMLAHVLAGSSTALGAPPSRPNVIIMLADNLGYGDVGVYGGGVLRGAPTPRIDELAREGFQLTNFNVELECTPSRAALMTGRMPVRSGTGGAPLLGNVSGASGGKKGPYGLAPSEITLAELLADEGYATALFGKWHLGNTAGRLPTDQGFDEWWGYPNSSREAMHSSDPAFDPSLVAPVYLMEGEKNGNVKNVMEFNWETRPLVDKMITDRSVSYVQEHAKTEQPFFLVTAFMQTHFPTLPHPDFKGRSGNGDFADSVMELDYRVGQILDAVHSAGISRNTLILFLSDNGALLVPSPGVREQWIGNNGPFRGELGTALEGSVRTIGIFNWAGKIRPGQVSNEIVTMTDVFPTISGFLDIQPPRDLTLDGVDQSQFLLGTQPKSSREHVLFFAGDELRAVKWRKFKVHFSQQNAFMGAIDQLRIPEVYNIESDPRENHNIAMSGMWVMSPINKLIQDYLASTDSGKNLID